jgi:hypothetical protein
VRLVARQPHGKRTLDPGIAARWIADSKVVYEAKEGAERLRG